MFTKTMAILAALTALITIPALAEPLKYVGFTSATFQGDQGVLGFHAACQAEIPGSQFCTSEDIIRSGNVPPGSLTAAQWVQPTFVGGYSTGVAPERGALDVSGAFGNSLNQLSCNSWSTNLGGSTVSGLAILTGKIATNGCATFNHVACCVRERKKKDN